MANIIKLKSVESKEGILSVFEHLMPGQIERVYFIYGVPNNKIRGGHRHKTTWQGLVCLNGSCKVYVQDEHGLENIYEINDPATCILLKPSDWHQMFDFSPNSILLVMANKNYDPEDYIDEAYLPERIIEYTFEEIKI